MHRRLVALTLTLVLLAAALPAHAGPDPRDYCIRSIYIGMPETDLQRKAGDMTKVTQTDLKELDANDKLELYSLKRDRDVIVGLDKQTRKVMVVLGNELTKDDRTVVAAGEFQYRAQLSLMPLQHDSSWVYHNDRFDITFLFTKEASKTAPVIYRVILTDPSLGLKGGWLGGVDPRPGPSEGGPQWR